MTNRNERIVRDAIRQADRLQVIWYNGPSVGQFSSMDAEFVKDVANAYARLCDRYDTKKVSQQAQP